MQTEDALSKQRSQKEKADLEKEWKVMTAEDLISRELED